MRGSIVLFATQHDFPKYVWRERVTDDIKASSWVCINLKSNHSHALVTQYVTNTVNDAVTTLAGFPLVSLYTSWTTETTDRSLKIGKTSN